MPDILGKVPWAVRLVVTTIALTGVSLTHGAGAQSLVIVFRDKPPYSYIENGVQKGFLLERMRRVLKLARIDAQFSDMPPKRIFSEIEANKQRICSFGWYKIPERESYAQFSQPLHQDRPHLLLAGEKSAPDIRRQKTLRGVMNDSRLTLAAADGVSYGPELDALISAFPGKLDRALIPPLLVAKKIAAGRADFMFIDQEDYDYLIASTPEFRAAGLIPVTFQDTPAGLKRYVLCSRLVDSETMKKIDAAIAAEAAGRH